MNSGTLDLTIPSQYAKLRFWRNTAVAKLASGNSITLAPDQGDGRLRVGRRRGQRLPAGRGVRHVRYAGTGLQAFTDYGSTLNSNASRPTTSSSTARHRGARLRRGNRAVVMGPRGRQRRCGGPDLNDPPDTNMQQATVNLLADMGASRPPSSPAS